VSALTAAADHRAEDARVAAQRVLSSASATYLDRVYAGIADASARCRQGDRGAALAALEPAWMTVNTTDDVVMRGVLRRVRRSLGADVVEPSQDDQGFPLLDWGALVDRLFAV
jgi:hypothetical protein